MISRPHVHQSISVIRNQAQDPPRLRLAGTDCFSDFHAHEVDNDDPAWANDMHMRRGMVIGVDHEPQPVDAQNRRHVAIVTKSERSENHPRMALRGLRLSNSLAGFPKALIPWQFGNRQRHDAVRRAECE
jgi:hypothetical protein